MATVEAPAPPFDSLADLRQEHLRLLRQARSAGGAAAARAEVEAFLDRAQATGARLDASPDREAAQGILDYWAAALLTAVGGAVQAQVARPAPPRVLAEFDAATGTRAADAAERALAAMSPAEVELARRVLLRLVELPPDGRTFAPVSVPRAQLEAVGDPARVGPVLAALERAGVFRVSSEADSPKYALRSEALMRAWPRYATWLDKRARFRDQVKYWEKNDRGRAALISGPLLSDTLAYHDLTGTEKEYLNRSREGESRDKRRWQAAFLVALVLLVLTVAGWLTAWKWARSERSAREAERGARAKAEDALAKEREAKKRVVETDAGRVRKEAVQNLSGLVQTLARASLSGDNEAEEDRAMRRWRGLKARWPDLIRRLGQNEADAVTNGIDPAPYRQFTGDVQDLFRQFERVDTSQRPEDPQSQSYVPLRLAQQVREKMEASRYRSVVEELDNMRKAAFEYAGHCTDEIVARIGRGDYDTAAPYIKEFWVLYWGEMGLAEGHQVASAMKDFGDKLRQIDDWVRGKLEPKAGKQARPPVWQQAMKPRDGGAAKYDLKKVTVDPKLVRELNALKGRLDDALRQEAVGQPTALLKGY